MKKRFKNLCKGIKKAAYKQLDFKQWEYRHKIKSPGTGCTAGFLIALKPPYILAITEWQKDTDCGVAGVLLRMAKTGDWV